MARRPKIRGENPIQERVNGVRFKDEDDRLENGSVQEEEEKKKIWGIPDNVRLERDGEGLLKSGAVRGPEEKKREILNVIRLESDGDSRLESGSVQDP